jgi:hypothetical protein
MTTGEPHITIWYDTEFLEDGRTIMPISIGMVRERYGQPGEFDELYLINREADLGRIQAHPWLAANVLPHLPVEQDEAGMWWWNPDHPDYDKCVSLADLRRAVMLFVLHDGERVQLCSWYASYDHVTLMQLFGPMSARPQGMPMWTYDLKQRQHELGVPDAELPAPQAGTEHNALADAWYHQQIDWHLRKVMLAQLAGR